MLNLLRSMGKQPHPRESKCQVRPDNWSHIHTHENPYTAEPGTT